MKAYQVNGIAILILNSDPRNQRRYEVLPGRNNIVPEYWRRIIVDRRIRHHPV